MSFSYGWKGPNIIKDGLIIYLYPGSPNSYFPKNSSTIRDISGYGNNGNLINFGSQTTYSSFSGGSIILDGTNDLISIPYTGNTLNNYTFSFYVNSNTMNSNPSTNRQTIFGLTNTGSSATLVFTSEIWGNLNVGFRGNGNSSTSYTFSPPGLNFNNINYHTITLTSTGNNYYLNGLSFSATNSTISTSVFDRIIIGSRLPLTGDNRLNGNFRMFKMYNRVLSDSEILQNYNTTKSIFGL